MNVEPAAQQEVTALLERGRELTAPALRAAVERLASPLDTIAAYHFGWIEADGRPGDGDTGKALRPALALLSAEAAGVDAAVGVPGAVAVELVHNFSLIHDDLIDHDEWRRHRKAVWKVHGATQAILVGDALFALAGEVVLEPPTERAARAARLLAVASRRLADGQAQDIAFEHRERVGLEEYRQMAGRKTGALLSCAAAIGAVLGGAEQATSDALAAYGEHLGLAFQVRDDLLGIWGDSRATGKASWSDLRRRKKSLPIAAAMSARNPAAERLTTLLAEDRKRSEEEFADIGEEALAERAALVEEAGGRRWAEEEAGRQHGAALTALSQAELPEQVRRRLTYTVDFAVARER